MRLVRRCTALLSAIFLLQLTLVGSWTQCSMDGRVSAGSQAPTHAVNGSDDCDKSPMPSSSGPCVSATGCAVIALPAVRVEVVDVVLASIPLVAVPSDLRSRPAAAPELPPPRVT
jgi:hypothetical protein